MTKFGLDKFQANEIHHVTILKCHIRLPLKFVCTHSTDSSILHTASRLLHKTACFICHTTYIFVLLYSLKRKWQKDQLSGEAKQFQIIIEVQIWWYQGRWTLFQCSKSCAIDRGTEPANVQRNILQSTLQQPSSSLEGQGKTRGMFIVTTQLQMKNKIHKDTYVVCKHGGEYLLQCEGKGKVDANVSVHTSELQQDISFISGSLDSKFLLRVQLCPLLLCDCPRLLRGKPR